MEKLIELKQKDKDFHEWNSLLRKRMRERRKSEIAIEEEAKKPKNFGLKMIDKLDQED